MLTFNVFFLSSYQILLGCNIVSANTQWKGKMYPFWEVSLGFIFFTIKIQRISFKNPIEAEEETLISE